MRTKMSTALKGIGMIAMAFVLFTSCGGDKPANTPEDPAPVNAPIDTMVKDPNAPVDTVKTAPADTAKK